MARWQTNEIILRKGISMRCFKSTRGYVSRFCAERGRAQPRSTWYLVEYDDGSFRRLPDPPRSYRKVKRVVFCVDDQGFVERVQGLWIEQLSPDRRRWLVEREVKRVLYFLASRKDLWDNLPVPRNADDEVRIKLWQYLGDVTQAHTREFDREVLETTRQAMAAAGELSLLKSYRDSLANPPQ